VHQPLVEERLRGRQHHAAVDVVLHVLPGLVAHPHRPHAAVAGQVRHLALDQPRLPGDPVHRLEMPVLARGDDVGDVAEEALHGAGGAEPVEPVHHEVRVPQPAVAVVPVAPAVRGLRDRGGHGRHDRAALVEGAQLQRDRGADHRLLPLEGDREVPRPVEPVVPGALEELPRRGADRRRQRLVRPEDQVERLLEDEVGLLVHVGDRRVRGEPHHQVRHHVADVVAAMGGGGAPVAVAVGRAYADPDARLAGHRTHLPDQHQRPVHAPGLDEARREVHHLDRAVVAVVQRGDDDRGVGQVALVAAREPFQLDVEEAGLGRRAVAGQQAREHRIAIEARQARPRDPAPRVEQGREAAVADQGEVGQGGIGPGRVETRHRPDLSDGSRAA
jgi:hypothetical protein